MAKSKLVEANQKIAEGAVNGYKKIEEGVVGGYKKIEEGAVGGFRKITDKFVDNFLTKAWIGGFYDCAFDDAVVQN